MSSTFRARNMGILLAVIGFVLGVSWVAARYAGSLFPSSADTLARLSNVGQAFGSASAVLAGLGLAGVLATLLLQQHQLRLQQHDSATTHDLMKRQTEADQRGLHFELMSLALSDPTLMEVWPAVGTSKEERRQSVYTNLILSHQQTLLVAGYLDPTTVRANLFDLFQSEAVQRFWVAVGPVRRSLEAPTREHSLFHELCDEAYIAARATAQSETIDVPETSA